MRILHTLLVVTMVTALTALAGGGVYAQKAQALTAREVAEKYKYSVFTIKTDKGLGTGFLVSPYALLTCLHVVGNATSVSAKILDKEPVVLRHSTGYDKSTDSILLSMPVKLGKPATIGDPEALQVGDKLFVVGSPQGFDQTITEGILSGRRKAGGLTFLQLSAAVSPGSSGSPVINDQGEVVGIVTGSVKESQQLNFAVDIYSVFGNIEGIPLSAVTKSGATADASDAAEMPIDKELTRIEAAEDEKADNEYRDLSASPSFSLIVDVPSSLEDLVSEEDARRWVAGEIGKTAPKAKVLTEKEQEVIRKSVDDKSASVVDHVTLVDSYSRYVHVRIDYSKSEKGNAAYLVDLSFDRGALFPAGRLVAPAYTTYRMGYIDPDDDVVGKLRENVQLVVKEFTTAWNEANK